MGRWDGTCVRCGHALQDSEVQDTLPNIKEKTAHPYICKYTLYIYATKGPGAQKILDIPVLKLRVRDWQ